MRVYADVKSLRAPTWPVLPDSIVIWKTIPNPSALCYRESTQLLYAQLRGGARKTPT